MPLTVEAGRRSLTERYLFIAPLQPLMGRSVSPTRRICVGHQSPISLRTQLGIGTTLRLLGPCNEPRFDQRGELRYSVLGERC